MRHFCKPCLLQPVLVGETPLCVAWETETASWADRGCALAHSNASHSTCRCDRLAAYAVMTAPTENMAPETTAFPIVTLQIVTYIVAAISVLCVVLILVKVGVESLPLMMLNLILIYILLQFRQNIQKILLKTPCLNQEEKHACNPRTRSCLNLGLSADKTTNHTLQVSYCNQAPSNMFIHSIQRRWNVFN